MEFTPEGFKSYLEQLKIKRSQSKEADEIWNRALFREIYKESLQQTVYKYMWFEAGKDREKFNKKKIKLKK